MNDTELTKRNENQTSNFPAFVEAEKMFDRMAEITKETAEKAYNFFLERGSQFGSQVEDWLRAEAETLRTAPVKITDSNDAVNVAIAVPGFKPEEIEVSVKDNVLIVSGETDSETTKDDETTFYSEWTSNKFMRKLTLPADVEAPAAGAKLKDGVLTLQMRKKANTEASKVSVQAA